MSRRHFYLGFWFRNSNIWCRARTLSGFLEHNRYSNCYTSGYTRKLHFFNNCDKCFNYLRFNCCNQSQPCSYMFRTKHIAYSKRCYKLYLVTRSWIERNKYSSCYCISNCYNYLYSYWNKCQRL